MERSGRPVSESYQPLCYSANQSFSFSSEVSSPGLEEEDDRAPIFSLSKSSMDVVMATGPPHKRDPAWIRTDLRRSSSANVHSEPNSVTLKPPQPLTPQQSTVEVHGPPALGERWMTNMQRWSQCSGSTQSRSSTPDTIIWREGSSRPSSLNQEAAFCAAPDSPVSKPTSRPNTPSPGISPLQTPTLATADLFTSSSSSLLTLSMHQQRDLAASSAKPSPVFSPLQAHTSSPLSTNSPNLIRLTSTEDEGFLENNLLSFTFPSPIPSSVCLAEEGVLSDPSCLDDDVMEDLPSPGGEVPEGGGASGEEQTLRCTTPNSPAARRESGGSVCYLELPWQPRQTEPTSQDRRLPLACSVSDSQLGKCCRCNLDSRGLSKAQKVNDGTMTSKPELVDAAAQTMSPVGSLWGLRRNISNTGSHSILGSPPGSRLNLKASVGSHSNLVSPSSSMFPMSSDEEAETRGGGDEQAWISPSSHEVDGRRSCLKTQGEDKEELGRRSSMKQVQWDEDGMTWDIHGASVDPEDLNMAIQKHLELKSTPRPTRRTSKKKKAPKPPVKSDTIKTLESDPLVGVITSMTCAAEGESETPPAAAAAAGDGGEDVEETDEDKKEETEEAVHRTSKAEGEQTKNEEKEEEEEKEKDEKEVPGEEGQPKSPSRGSAQSRKRSIIRSLRRPGWCGGSRKADD